MTLDVRESAIFQAFYEDISREKRIKRVQSISGCLTGNCASYPGTGASDLMTSHPPVSHRWFRIYQFSIIIKSYCRFSTQGSQSFASRRCYSVGAVQDRRRRHVALIKSPLHGQPITSIILSIYLGKAASSANLLFSQKLLPNFLPTIRIYPIFKATHLVANRIDELIKQGYHLFHINEKWYWIIHSFCMY